MPATVRYTYIRDPQNINRVLTVAREFDPETMQVRWGVSLCSPKCQGTYDPFGRGDKFQKEIGRKIAVGRMHKRGFYVTMQPHELPLEVVMSHLSGETEVPNPLMAKTVMRIVRWWLTQPKPAYAEREAQAQ